MLLAIISGVYAQVNDKIQPKSFTISEKELTAPKLIQLTPLNLTEAERLDNVDQKTGDLPKFSRSVYTNLSIQNAGSWTELANGDRIWRMQLTSQGALGLIPFFNKFHLPPGATLHVYTTDREEVLGAFTSDNNSADGYFCTGLIHGENCIIEYYEPYQVRGMGYFNINEVGYAYRWVRPLHKDSREFGTSQSCEVNVNCTEGANYQDEKRAVVRILVQSSQGQGFCTGTLVNNLRQDCTPYLLSAQHCSEGTSTNQYSQWVFYFNYEAPGCANPASEGSLGNKVVIGCTKKADSNDNGGDTGSDFLLLQLNTPPQQSYNPYYAGWNANNTAPVSGVSIHHPDADIKKISTYITPGVTDRWGNSVNNTHWRITWAPTLNGFGVTEEGSSGSALFNTSGQVVGQLTGGNSFCNTPTQPDLYGKFSYNWVSNGSTDARRLKPWLDPDNTGTLSVNGVNHPCATNVTDAGVTQITAPPAASCGNSVIPVITVRNYGSATLTSVTITYVVDGTTYTYSWTGSIAPANTASISLPAVTVSAGNHTIAVSTSSPNGTADGNTGNDAANATFITANTADALNFYLRTDDYGNETTWEVTDNTGNVLYRGGPYPQTSTGNVYNIPICLNNGCYKLKLYDSEGDGFTGGNVTNGDMLLTGPNGSPVYASLQSANFGFDEIYDFCIGSVGLADMEAINIQVFPNPSSGIFNIRFDGAVQRTITIYNTLGEIVSTAKTDTQQWDINISNQSAGIYILQVESTNGKALKKLIVK